MTWAGQDSENERLLAPSAPLGVRRDASLSTAAFVWLDAQRRIGKETFNQEDTSNRTLLGESLRLMPTQQGIWKPAHLEAALSIRTVYRAEGAARPLRSLTSPGRRWIFNGTRRTVGN